jgi:two-component system cell cycle sensor histidine kinase/response regulator CckA
MRPSEPMGRSPSLAFRILIPTILCGGFVIDLLTPRGFADWALYLLPILLAMQRGRRRTLLLIAGTGSVFTLLGLFLSPPGSPLWISGISRGFGLMLIWTTALVSLGWRRAEDTLREREDRLRLLLDSTAEGILGSDLDGRCTFCNPSSLRLLGYEHSEQLVGKKIHDLIHHSHPDGMPRLEENCAIIQAISKGEGTHIEDDVLWKADGTHFHAEYWSYPQRREGKVIGVVVTFVDITSRKQAEEETRRSENKYRTLVENLPQNVAYKDRNSVYISCNKNYARDLHIFPDEIVGKTDYDFFPPELAEKYRNDDRRVMESGEVQVLEEHYHRDGKLNWVNTVKTPVLDQKGNVIGILLIFWDITNRKRAEEALVRLRQAVDASGEVVFMTDREGLITFANPEFARLYGYPEAEVVGKTTPRILKSGTTPPEHYTRLWETILSKQVAREEMTNRTKDGRLVTVESSANPVLDDRGSITGFLAIQRDVTARKQLEEQFRQAQKMEAVGRLAGGVAHDFNNLLTIINGYAQLFLEDMDSSDPQYTRIGEILKAGERAAGLTRQLLAFSRRQVLEPKVLNLNNVVEGMRKMLQRLIGEDIELRSILDPTLSQTKVDPGQIEQIIMNLAVNARDAMPEGGTFILHTYNADLDETYASTHAGVVPRAYVALAVSDSGIGMDRETQAHIFEPFFTTKEQGKGTGLGLATVYGIVKQSGGHISVYSEPGKGTAFKIYLPRVEGTAAASGPTAECRPTLTGTETILLVEDDAGVQKLAADILESNGYHLLVASDPEEAAQVCDHYQKPIHLLLTDVVMPKSSGRQLAEHLTFSHPKLKVLYMSGYTNDTVVHQGILEEGKHFLQKPFTPESLLRKVREVLDT